MTNLSEKFTAFEQQTAEQHTSLVAILTETNVRLNIIANTLVAMQQNTERMQDAIWPLTDPAISDERASLRWALYRLMDATAPAWPRPTSVPVQPGIELLRSQLAAAIGVNVSGVNGTLMALIAQVINNLGIPTGDATTTVLGRLAAIENSNLELVDNVGFPTGDATTTVLGRLATIENYSKCFCGPQLPSSSDPNGCASPWTSASAVTASGRTYGVWPTPATGGVNFTTTLGVGVANTEISPVTDWTGFKLFVYSKKASYYMDAPLSGVLRPTNTWRALSGSAALAISVPDGSDIQVLLCAPVAVTTPCTTYNSSAITTSKPGDSSFQNVPRNAIVFPSTLASTTDTLGFTYTQPVIRNGNFQNWSVQALSGNYRIVMYNGATISSTNVFTGGNNSMYYIPGYTTAIYFDDYQRNNAFSLRMCEPGAS